MFFPSLLLAATSASSTMGFEEHGPGWMFIGALLAGFAAIGTSVGGVMWYLVVFFFSTKKDDKGQPVGLALRAFYRTGQHLDEVDATMRSVPQIAASVDTRLIGLDGRMKEVERILDEMENKVEDIGEGRSRGTEELRELIHVLAAKLGVSLHEIKTRHEVLKETVKIRSESTEAS